MPRKISFKKGTRAYEMRREIAEKIARDHPGISMSQKFRMAAGATKRNLGRRHRKVSARRT